MAQGVPARLRPRIFFTFRHYKGGRSSAKRTGRLYPRKNPWYSLSEAGSTSGHMVLSGEPRKKSPLTPPGIDPGTVRLVGQRLNHYANPDPINYCSRFNYKIILNHCQFNFTGGILNNSQSQWPCLRRRSKAARLLGLRVRILLEHGSLSLLIVVCFQVEGQSLVPRSPTKCAVYLSVVSKPELCGGPGPRGALEP